MRRIAPPRQCIRSTWLLCIIHSSWRRLTLLRPEKDLFQDFRGTLVTGDGVVHCHSIR